MMKGHGKNEDNSLTSKNGPGKFIATKVVTSCRNYIQSSVKTFLPGFGNVWLKYCAIVECWGGQRNILRVILETKQECFYTTL